MAGHLSRRAHRVRVRDPEELVTQVGEGITGYAAITGQTYYAPDALHDERGMQIEGTDEIEESLLAVPLKVGDKVTGVIVLSNLGTDQFEEDDQRVLEVLASHASVAYENASLLQKEREAAKTASALLGLSQALSGAGNVSSVLARVVAAVPSIIDGSAVVASSRPEDRDFIPAHHRGLSLDRPPRVPADLASRFLSSFEEPFVIEREMAEQVPTEFWLVDEPAAALIAPMSWEPDEFGALVVLAPDAESTFSERDRDLARGIAQIASLALGSARHVRELERFHELAETLDAIFWEAEPQTLAFTFLSKRASLVLGHETDTLEALPQRWGDHIVPDDRTRMTSTLRAAVAIPGDDLDLEYRTRGRKGRRFGSATSCTSPSTPEAGRSSAASSST